MKRLILAGSGSGSGKTTVATGLIAAFEARGVRVQAFKTGPDYIDPGYHQAACGRPSRNLDTWMLSPEANRAIFSRAASRAGLALIEGVMGLYDGAGSGLAGDGSTASLARLLKAPVVMVIDASGLAQSAAAVVLGFRSFDPGVDLAGVIFNRVGSPRHYELLREAVESLGGIRCYGYLPRDPELALPERHLGLVPHLERQGLEQFLERLRTAVSQTIDLDGLYRLGVAAGPLEAPAGENVFRAVAAGQDQAPRVRVGLARDRAFSFYYQDNLDLLESCGAELVEFSPLGDERLPPDLDGVILGGGFPEVFRSELSANGSMLDDLRRAAARGLAIYAECGGLMYLSQGIAPSPEAGEGDFSPMVGLIPARAVMGTRRAALGYTRAVLASDSPVGGPGLEARGHEFHWSTLKLPAEGGQGAEGGVGPGYGGGWHPAYRAVSPRHLEPRSEGLTNGRVLAAYTHLHFWSNPSLAANFVRACDRGSAV